PRAYDEGSADEATVAPEGAHDVADREPGAEDRDDVERPEHEHEPARVGEAAAEEEGPGHEEEGGQGGALEDDEGLVGLGPLVAVLVEAHRPERERMERQEEGEQREVRLHRRDAEGRRDHVRPEADEVRGDEGDRARERVARDERQDQPEAALLQHAVRASRPAPSAASTRAVISARNAASPQRSACARIFSALQPVTSLRWTASISAGA